MEEVQRVRLDDLSAVEQPAQLLGRRGGRAIAGDDIHRFGCREVVTDWTDAAQPLHRAGTSVYGRPR